MSEGITDKGRPAEQAIEQLTGYIEPKIEVKGLDLNGTGTTTINQVRAKTLAPLVVYHHPTKQCYVVPPLDVIRLVSGRPGQHGISPFENCTLAIKTLAPFLCKTEQVKEAIEQAFLDDATKNRLETHFAEYKAGVQQLATALGKKLISN